MLGFVDRIYWDQYGGMRNMLKATWLSFVIKLAVLGCLVTLLLPTRLMAADAVVTDVRVGPQARVTRVVLELSNQVPYTVFSLANPYRVVIDLPEVGWRLPQKPLPRRSGVFETLRYGLYKPGNSRIVIDLTKPAIIKKTFILAPGGTHAYRLVVDLLGSSKTVFARHQKDGPIEVAQLGTSLLTIPNVAKIAAPGITPPKKPSITVASGAHTVASGAHTITSGAQQKKTYKNPDTLRNPNKLEKIIASLTKKTETAARAKNIANATFQLAPRKPENRRNGHKRVIVIDAGHGGPDPGTIGNSGIYEKHITLAMARELGKQLTNSGRYKVVYTRQRDIFIRLRERVSKGREAGADLFISLHADSIKDRKISGPAVYTLSENASDKEAAALAHKENKSDLIAGIDLTHENRDVTNILIDLAQRESMNQSAILAGHLIKALKRKVKVLRNTHRFAGFAVLKAPDMPSVLVETGFLSSPKDERNLRSRAYRERFSAALKKGIDAYFTRVEEAQSR